MSSAGEKLAVQPSGSALFLMDNRVLAMIRSQSPLFRILEAICAEIEKHDAALLCSVLLLNNDGQTLRVGAAPSLPPAYSKAVDGVPIGPCHGSCGTAMHRNELVIVSDIAADPLWASCRQFALPHGLRACWSAPIPSQDGTPLGTFAIYYREPRTPDQRHLQLIAHATHLAALAIERDRDKSQLRAAEDRYRNLVERLPAITYVAELGADGPWHYVSPQIESILGFAPLEWLAEPSSWLNRIHPDDRHIAIAAEERFQQTHELFQAEYRMFGRNGQVLWFRDEGVLLREAHGDHRPLMQGVLYDITEHKRLEEQLRHSQKLEALGQLAGGIAHDFNNLLMVIHARNELLRARLAVDDPAHKDSTEIDRAVTRASGLTRQLLAFSRRQVLQLKAIDLNHVVTETAKMLDRLIPAHIDLELINSAGTDHIKADPGQMEQVILNLAVNARDAMPNGGRLTIAARNVHLRETRPGCHTRIPPGRYVVLSVSDSGLGMCPDVEARIFEPFFTTKQPGEGTGLGLAIVYGVVQQSGGWIAVESEPGRGTTFDIYFPPAAAEKAAAATSLKALPAASPIRGTETILLAEDEEAIRDLVCEYLTKLGYTVLPASDGSHALQVASSSKDPIHLLLTDMVMPNLGGQEVARRLTKFRGQMKVLFMSGYPDHGNIVSDLPCDGAAVLDKPFTLDTLARKLRTLLDT